ncbi:MAG: hypothetical protein PHE99_01175 [Bacteroidales bacterium]|nr:hypothetical protein [Bacteroidales bacterium]MDD4656767.1 hypothetical protein [Bacteroidales bacterium]
MKINYFIVITLICIIQSCAKENSCTPCNVTFKGNLDISSKAYSYLRSDVKVSILTFQNLNGTPYNFTPHTYLTSIGFGSFTTTKTVALATGFYNFFSISYNNQYTPNINFNNNLLATPYNGKEYIWSSRRNVLITNNRVVTLVYKHISTKINIEVNAPTSFENLVVKYIKFSLPDCSNSSIDLKAGEITSATSVLPPSLLPGRGNSRTFVTIPCSAPKKIEVSIDATIAGELIKNKVYSSTISTPFNGGVFYTINLAIEDMVTSSLTISCKEWSCAQNNIPY